MGGSRFRSRSEAASSSIACVRHLEHHDVVHVTTAKLCASRKPSRAATESTGCTYKCKHAKAVREYGGGRVQLGR